jgi:hypothetical protein
MKKKNEWGEQEEIKATLTLNLKKKYFFYRAKCMYLLGNGNLKSITKGILRK